tara:strand:+ start:1018 stop:2049 length:1032 start_codon:yes stop_codon:yes gene_type:complete
MTSNYWATPNMGKMHMMHLIEVNRQSYTKNKYPYYFYKQWEDPTDYKKRVEKTFVVRRGQSTVEGPIKIKTTFGETSEVRCKELHPYLKEVGKIDNGLTIEKIHSNTLQVGGDLMKSYFGNFEQRKPPDVLMKDKDPVEVFFTNKWFCDLQKHFPVSPSPNYLGTFLEPYLSNNIKCIASIIDELCDVDVIFEPFTMMGRYMTGTLSHPIECETEIEKYVLNIYKSRKNVIPYKEDLIDCFASKLTRWHGGQGTIWDYLDKVVRNLRRIEVYFQKKGLEPVYFNMDRDSYKDTFGFENDNLPRTYTHPGNYPERKKYEQIAKEYVMMRNMKDMRRRGKIHDWI